MTRIVVVHGVGHRFEGSRLLHATIAAAVADGVTAAGGAITPEDVHAVSYGPFFREPAETLGDPRDVPDDLVMQNLAAYLPDDPALETSVVLQWWEQAAATEPGVLPPSSETLFRAPLVLQRALLALLRTRYFSGLTLLGILGDLSEVARYFRDDDLRNRIIEQTAGSIGPDCRVVVGHSLGSVVAYETLHRFEREDSIRFISLGSPLGLPGIIYPRLRPDPAVAMQEHQSAWPRAVRSWVNVVDRGDVVAAQKDLGPQFGSGIEHIVVNNGARAHDLSRYLVDAATGRAVMSVLP